MVIILCICSQHCRNAVCPHLWICTMNRFTCSLLLWHSWVILFGIVGKIQPFSSSIFCQLCVIGFRLSRKESTCVFGTFWYIYYWNYLLLVLLINLLSIYLAVILAYSIFYTDYRQYLGAEVSLSCFNVQWHLFVCDCFIFLLQETFFVVVQVQYSILCTVWF